MKLATIETGNNSKIEFHRDDTDGSLRFLVVKGPGSVEIQTGALDGDARRALIYHLQAK